MSSGSDWECSGAKQGAGHKPHFSVTSCDTGLKLKIAAIPPRKVTTKKGKPSVKKKTAESTPKQTKAIKDRPAVKKKGKSQLSETSTSSESCSKCSSDSSSDDDLPLKAVSKALAPKGSPQAKNTKNTLAAKSDSDEDKRTGDNKDNASKTNNKDKTSASKTNSIVVKKTKSDESSHDSTVKRGRGRPRTKVSVHMLTTYLYLMFFFCFIFSKLELQFF